MLAGLSRRQFSSVARVCAQSPNLPHDKLRALISIYHQAETFVTKENLDEKINEAFVDRDSYKDDDRLTFANLEALLNRRKNASKVTEWYPHSNTDADFSWKDRYRLRDARVIEALYGVETLGLEEPLPGLESLRDAYAGDGEESKRYPKSDFD